LEEWRKTDFLNYLQTTNQEAEETRDGHLKVGEKV
jgi:hypothetical protein